MKHLLSIDDLGGASGIDEVLRVTDRFVEVSARDIPKVPALRGYTVAWLFYEDSTRTRLSFETAAKRLSADTMNFSVSSSSVNKGESLRDTVETIAAMGVDAIVVRHKSAGVPWQIARWLDAPEETPSGASDPETQSLVGPTQEARHRLVASKPGVSSQGVQVINAGDGWHEHPTQALLDSYTIRHHLGSLEGKHIAIVGDSKHSRVARSNVKAFAALGAEVTLVGPQTLLPPSLEGWPVAVSHDLDAVLPTVDVCYLLRMQRERMTEALVPSLREYHTYYGLDSARAARMQKGSIIMHPGPMNRGVEITAEVAGLDNAVIAEQVANGVAVRMAVLFLLLGSGVDVIGGQS